MGKRKLGTGNWQLKETAFTGNTKDAHNVISIITDGAGYLHMAWNHHNNPLNYVRSLEPGGLQFGPKMPMTGVGEGRVSYPEFYRMPNGDLLFFYRDGGSGNGNLVLNKYDAVKRAWRTLHNNLISGEGKRNPYWQACIDGSGTIHISWVWRESPDVASNHDLMYARSTDDGATWQRSNGEAYTLPITQATAEVAAAIPQKSELINQTSMFAAPGGEPFIATYWRDSMSSVPQYRLVYKNGQRWQTQNLAFRTTPFSLSGGGSKSIPIARPQIIAWQIGRRWAAAIIFRDEERGSKVSVALNKNIKKSKWRLLDLSQKGVGSWEPSFDTELWREQGLLHLFVQNAVQVDGEGLAKTTPQMVQVLEWNPKLYVKKTSRK
ncbi:BNR repeat-containing protein [Pseudocnuella soli]|uniref:BNR repeat-containing protein n=1 Tax=Pseudocnuella soli TaxID=2502779 RepID=UPI001F007E5C|nr:BNR repeat-containing protein [Pseudocnuella soli]